MARSKGGESRPASASIADKLRKRIAKNHGEEIVPTQEDAVIQPMRTGSEALDHALGVGGFARGRIYAIQGPEHSGKTSLAYLAAAQFQKDFAEELVVFINVERRHSASLAQVIGVDINPDRFLVLEPDTAEEACACAMEAMGYVQDSKGAWSDRPEETPCGLLIYDSWGGSPTKGVAMAELARIGSQWWPKLAVATERSNATFIATNHVHYKPGVVYGNPEYATGGEKFKYAQTGRLAVHKEGDVEKDAFGIRIGHTMRINIEKNGLAPPFKVIRLHLNYYGGFDKLKDVYELAVQKGLSFKETPTGNYLVLANPETGEVVLRENGEKNFFLELRGDPDAAELFMKIVRDWEPNGKS